MTQILKGFWNWLYAVLQTDEPKDPYWMVLVENNIERIIKSLGPVAQPRNEEEARELYREWCVKTDVLAAEEPKEKLVANCEVKVSPNLSDRMIKACGYDSNKFIDVESFNLAAKPTYKVWIYNVSRQSFTVVHPVLRTVTVPANTTRKKYVLFTSLPNVVQMPQANIDTDEITAKPMRGERLAMDLINPDNLGLDQDAEIRWRTSIGRNLGEMGVFWSLSNPPKASEVAAAVKRMEGYYKRLLEQAEALEKVSIEREFQNIVTPAHHAAAEHFKITNKWHPRLKK